MTRATSSMLVVVAQHIGLFVITSLVFMVDLKVGLACGRTGSGLGTIAPPPWIARNGLREARVIRSMNWDIVKGKWNWIKGDVHKEWGDLTDDDYDGIGGEKDKLVGTLQERYGWNRHEAERRVDDWFERHT